jgi:hypothetical protein
MTSLLDFRVSEILLASRATTSCDCMFHMTDRPYRKLWFVGATFMVALGRAANGTRADGFALISEVLG